MISDEGVQVGIVGIEEALQMAKERELDLVEISPNANPPVCKVMNYGKYLYKLQKREKEAKKKQLGTQLKEIRFSAKIEEHDYQHKLKRIIAFLQKGHKVKLSLFFRGREITHKDFGIELMARVEEDVKGIGAVHQATKMEGRKLFLILRPN